MLEEGKFENEIVACKSTKIYSYLYSKQIFVKEIRGIMAEFPSFLYQTYLKFVCKPLLRGASLVAEPKTEITE